MELHTESNPALNTVTAYGDDYIDINEQTYRHAIYFGPEGEVKHWNVRSVADITTAQLKQAAGLTTAAKADPMAFLDDTPITRQPDWPEVIIVGTGLKHQLLPATVVSELLSSGIGVEAMSTQAAARTYNILMAEGRRVIAALLPLEPL